MDFWTLGKLEFEKPDMDTFHGLALAYEAGECGGTLPTVFNAANELAVSQFLNREIKYLEITEIIEDCMKAHKKLRIRLWNRFWRQSRKRMTESDSRR